MRSTDWYAPQLILGAEAIHEVDRISQVHRDLCFCFDLLFYRYLWKVNLLKIKCVAFIKCCVHVNGKSIKSVII